MTNAAVATEGIAIMMAVANYVLCSVAEMRQLSTTLVDVTIPLGVC